MSALCALLNVLFFAKRSALQGLCMNQSDNLCFELYVGVCHRLSIARHSFIRSSGGRKASVNLRRSSSPIGGIQHHHPPELSLQSKA